jgi:succinate dehydrogenase / fumarate reductase membrane anchor subunit
MVKKGSHSQHKGTRHWILQRISALLLMPLSLWIISSGRNYVYKDYELVLLWVSKPITLILLQATLLLLLLHAYLGMIVIVDDYVQGVWRTILNRVLAVTFIVIGASTALSILLISTG